MTYPGHPSSPSWPPPPVPEDGRWQPARVEPVSGTDYGLVQIQVPPVTSGLATGAMIAGIAAIGVALLVLCFGAAGSQDGWGPLVAGAFTLLAVLFGGGAVGVGLFATRQIRGSGRDGRLRFVGRGQAIAGVSCGAAGAGIALLALGLSFVMQAS
jgi:hypothetical protein